jgi:hypothetical protein
MDNNLGQDILGDYQIDFNKPISELNTPICKAYTVYNPKKHETNLYALVFEPGSPIRFDVLAKTKNTLFHNFITPIETGIIDNSSTKRQHFTAILRKPPFITLEQYISENGSLSPNFVLENIFQPLHKLLQSLKDHQVLHGSINPQTIYLNDNKEVILSEAISTSCGLLQPSLYEPIERADLIAVAKGGGDISIDYHALGVTCLRAILGNKFPKFTSDTVLTDSRYKNGTCETLITDHFMLSAPLRKLFKGLLNDIQTERYTITQINDWFDGKHNINISHNTTQASRPILFNDNRHLTCTSLAYDMYANWDLAKKFIYEDELLKWLERGVGNIDAAEKIYQIMTNLNKSQGASNAHTNAYLTKILTILDNKSSLRFKDAAINFDGLGDLIAYSYAKNKKDYFEYFTSAINSGLWWGHASIDSLVGMKLDKIKSLLDKKSYGFGLERCLYELNDKLPCQSPYTSTGYISNLKDLLVHLNNKGTDPNNVIMDRHIAAFIMCKLNAAKEIMLHKLMKYPTLANHHDIITCVILSNAQDECPGLRLDDLAEILATRISVVISEIIHNRNRKEEVSKKLLSLAKEGKISLILNFILSPDYLSQDQLEFSSAVQKYLSLNRELHKLQQKGEVYNKGFTLGLKIAVIISYAICAITIVLLIGGILG